MTETHIPDEVVEAGAKASYEAWEKLADISDDGWDAAPDDVKNRERTFFRAALTAAIAAWTQTGMARDAFAYPCEPRRPDDWSADTAYIGDDGDKSFPVLIIRTEAPEKSPVDKQSTL